MSRILDVQSIVAGYGEANVLTNVSIYADKAEVVSIVGANGAGKTTLISTLAGVIKPRSGEVYFQGERITDMPAHERPQKMLAMVPEGGRLFPFMTVLENLKLGAFPERARSGFNQRLEEIFDIFSILRERRGQLAGHLSGGERQMCAIARAMMSRPALLMLDEPSVGLSPVMTERVFETIRSLATRDNLTVLLVEQNVGEALDISDRGYVIDHGSIAMTGLSSELKDNPQVQGAYMGL
ncbi:MAG: branched-chain amino acid ABC transporter ATP-binding protein [Rhizobiales bacterium 65-9]|nr:ABC transporter ATP-binding protein [Hyphomicrobiales bacterium]OJY33189.1 MAG: branched-chain amino acid ABC transporter ATP-binding protein [Rhizobiales bacterium 65-9]